MPVRIRYEEVATVVIVREQVEACEAYKLHRVRRQQRDVASVVVDLTEAPTLNAPSLGELIRLTIDVKAAGGRVHLVCPDARLRRLFVLADLAPMFTFFTSADDALQALGGDDD